MVISQLVSQSDQYGWGQDPPQSNMSCSPGYWRMGGLNEGGVSELKVVNCWSKLDPFGFILSIFSRSVEFFEEMDTAFFTPFYLGLGEHAVRSKKVQGWLLS